MKLSLESIYHLPEIPAPKYDVELVRENTNKRPKWLHFGAGNLFRAYVARIEENLLNKNLEDTGIIVAESFDYEVIDKVYRKNDNLGLAVALTKEGKFVTKVRSNITSSLKTSEDIDKILEIATKESLQIISFTITEKGYNLRTPDGNYLGIVEHDLKSRPEEAGHVMSITTRAIYERFKANKAPLALVSMDNCAANGDRVKAAVLEIAKHWIDLGFIEPEFMDYITDETKISYPISMIDKITPRPAPVVEKYLEEKGLEGMEIIVTDKNTYTSAFVNSETAEYFVVEDKFPNGRPAIEKSEAGVYVTNRDTVEKTERMKVTTCLNPLHTTLAIFGCLLNQKTIFEATSNPLLNKLIKEIGYNEALKVVVNPGIIDPKAFIDEVINERFLNPFIPDAPERIATDTSQKMAIRFGETLKAYRDSKTLKLEDIKYIPLVYAGWFRYLLGVDDKGNERSISSDPMLDTLKEALNGIEFGNPSSYKGQLKPILKNDIIFGLDLESVGIGEFVEQVFVEMIAGTDAVSNTLKKYLY